MKIDIQYLREHEQMLKIKIDLIEAFRQVAKMRKSKARKQTLLEFLNEL